MQDRENGLLFENEDIEGLAERIQKVLTDNSLRQHLITNGLKTAFEKFTMEKTIDGYEEYFESLVSSQ